MTTLKGWITTTCVGAMLVTFTLTANAGTIIGGLGACTEPGTTKIELPKDYLGGTIIGGLTGTIIGGFAGTIIGGFAGTIIGGLSDQGVTPNCQ